MCGLFLSKVYYSQLDFKIRLTRCTHSVCPRFLHIPGPQEGQISPGAELLEQLYSSQAVGADVPYQLAEKLVSIVSSRFSLRNLLGLGFFFPFCLRCDLCWSSSLVLPRRSEPRTRSDSSLVLEMEQSPMCIQAAPSVSRVFLWAHLGKHCTHWQVQVNDQLLGGKGKGSDQGLHVPCARITTGRLVVSFD